MEIFEATHFTHTSSIAGWVELIGTLEAAFYQRFAHHRALTEILSLASPGGKEGPSDIRSTVIRSTVNLFLKIQLSAEVFAIKLLIAGGMKLV